MQIGELLEQLAQVIAEEPADAMLALLMLCHGNRVGETRMAQWAHVSLAVRNWHIPAANTKTRAEHSLAAADRPSVRAAGLVPK